MTTNMDFAVGVLDTAASRDSQLVRRLTELINDVYAEAEEGLWNDGVTRTTTTEVAELIAAGQIAAASSTDGHIVGSVRIRTVSEGTSEFGMLVSAPDLRGHGIGATLVEFAEQHSRASGRHAMQLELLVPRTWKHPTKEHLKSWYDRIGYRRIATRSVDRAYPQFAGMLATPCDIEVHEKSLL